MVRGRELSHDTNASAIQMAEEIFGEGVTVVGASYTGDSRSSAIYSRGDDLSPGVTPGDTGAILSTGFASSFTNSNGPANKASDTTNNTSGPNNDPDFNALAGTNTYDAAFLEIDFIPDADTLTMQFVFSSEEFPEFTNSSFQDVVGVWVNGEAAELSVSSGTVNPASINSADNGNLLLDNADSDFNTEMDGFTVTLTLKMKVNPGEVNTIKIGIADVADSSFDSNLLIAGGSLQTALIAGDDTVQLVPGTEKTIDVLGNDEGPSDSQLVITHINGQEVAAGDTVTLNSGQHVTLNGDGTFTLLGDGDVESVNFTYTVAAGNGISDTAFVTINQIPCFVRGARIRTPSGAVPVEALAVGDLVITLDEGPQPIRWIGRRPVPAQGRFAPVRIARGARRDLRVSPQHRILVRDGWAELMFGEAEILVAARDLVNDRTIRVEEGPGEVEYVHLMFDRHQVIFAEGLATESFLPGPMVMDGFEAAVREEICALFPELDPDTGAGYGPAARLSLKGYEAGALATRLAS